MDARIRFEHGLAGGRSIARGDDVLIVVVDVLSFSTTVGVAAERGIDVVPARWGDGRASDLAKAHGAVLAGRRGDAGVSLSPASIRRSQGVRRIVLPSPNGSTLSAALAEQGTVVAGSLRNASAVARLCAAHLERSDTSVVAVVAAGERWGDGSLRPAWEDVWGAGAVLAALCFEHLASLEVVAAVDAFRSAQHRDLPLGELTSGRELIDAGFGEDVAIAAHLDASDLVPVLDGGVFRRG